MPSVTIRIGNNQHTDANFSWWEVWGSQTNHAIGDVIANAEWDSWFVGRHEFHTGLTAGQTWYYWARAAYDKGATVTGLVSLGSVLVTGSGGSVSFLGLTDTPSSYTGHASKIVTVKGDETGLEFVSPSAAAFSGAMVSKAADQTGANYTTGPVIAWTSEIYDTDNYHDNSTNNSFLTVPSNGKYRIGCNVSLANVSADVHVALILTKNGSATFDGAAAIRTEVGVVTPLVSFSSGPIPAVAGDDFEVVMNVETDTSIDVTAARSNFWVERVE